MAALRIGPKRVLGGGRDLGQSLAFVIVVQIACPLVYAGLLLVTGWQSPLALMFAALPISGSPSTTQLTGHDGAPALLPLTVLPTFWLLPDLSGGGGVFDAAFNLLLLIFVAALQALDGVSAAVLAIMVVGLMAAVGRRSLAILWGWSSIF